MTTHNCGRLTAVYCLLCLNSIYASQTSPSHVWSSEMVGNLRTLIQTAGESLINCDLPTIVVFDNVSTSRFEHQYITTGSTTECRYMRISLPIAIIGLKPNPDMITPFYINCKRVVDAASIINKETSLTVPHMKQCMLQTECEVVWPFISSTTECAAWCTVQLNTDESMPKNSTTDATLNNMIEWGLLMSYTNKEMFRITQYYPEDLTVLNCYSDRVIFASSQLAKADPIVFMGRPWIPVYINTYSERVVSFQSANYRYGSFHWDTREQVEAMRIRPSSQRDNWYLMILTNDAEKIYRQGLDVLDMCDKIADNYPGVAIRFLEPYIRSMHNTSLPQYDETIRAVSIMNRCSSTNYRWASSSVLWSNLVCLCKDNKSIDAAHLEILSFLEWRNIPNGALEVTQEHASREFKQYVQSICNDTNARKSVGQPLAWPNKTRVSIGQLRKTHCKKDFIHDYVKSAYEVDVYFSTISGRGGSHVVFELMPTDIGWTIINVGQTHLVD